MISTAERLQELVLRTLLITSLVLGRFPSWICNAQSIPPMTFGLFNFNPDSCTFANTLPRGSICSLSDVLATKMSSMYTMTLEFTHNRFSIVPWKMFGADATTNGSLEY